MSDKTEIRTALITGASAGIGAAGALALAKHGFNICMTARNKDKLQNTADMIIDKIGREDSIITCAGDVTNERYRQKAVEMLMEKWGRLDVLVNNAGSALAGALEDVNMDETRAQMEVNALAPMGMMQLAGPIMRKQGGGRIINMSSISGLMSLPGLGVYSASKYALEALNDAARREYHAWGIKVILIEPGGIVTNIWNSTKNDLLRRITKSGGSAFRDFYELQVQQLDRLTNGGTNVKEVADVLLHAATAKKPRLRYCLPKHCRDRRMVSHLPTAIEDWIVRKYIKVNRPANCSQS